MNSEKVQTIINQIISDLHSRIGGKAARKQYPVAKHQIQTLEDLGIIDLMPKGFGHSDAKAVIEEAMSGATSVMDSNYEGSEIGASALYKAIHEVAETSEPEAQTFTVSERNNEIVIDGEIFRVMVSKFAVGNIWLEIDGGCAADEDGNLWQVDGNYVVAELHETIEPAGDSYDHEFQVTITSEMIAIAKSYRAEYPLDVESEF